MWSKNISAQKIVSIVYSVVLIVQGIVMKNYQSLKLDGWISGEMSLKAEN